MRRLGTRQLAVLAVVVTLFGFVFLRGPTPHISIKPETLFSIGMVNVTNTIITSWITVILLVGLVYLGTRRRELVPRGFQNFFEAIIEAFYNLVSGVAGERNGRRFFPVVATIFFFILFANWFSLTPVFNVIGLAKEEVLEENIAAEEEEEGTLFSMEKIDLGPLPIAFVGFSGVGHLQGDSFEKEKPEDLEDIAKAQQEDGKFVGELIPVLRGANTDLNTPLAIAIVSAIAVEFWGLSTLGLGTYGGKFFKLGRFGRGLRRFNFGMIAEGAIDAFVGFLELISELIRLVSFTFRLFGNMFAGEVVILMFTFLFPIFVLTSFVYGLELFIGVIQAFIFAMLTLVFAVMAVSHHDESGHNEAGA